MIEIKLNDMRTFINKDERISVCIAETKKYTNYSSIDDIPSTYDDLYVCSIGLIESEIYDENYKLESFKPHIEIVLSNKSIKELNKYQNIYKIGSIYATNNFGELEFYQVANVYGDKVDLIQIGRKHIKENKYSKYLPSRVLDINNFNELYYHYGHCYNKQTITIVDGDKEYIDDVFGTRYVEYNGEIFNTLKLDK